ncbi:MAG TPA: tetratricopeptide repeat protein [bacterium]
MPSIAILVLLAAVTTAVLLPMLGNGYVFDDLYYVQQNAHVQKGLTASGVRWAFTTFYESNWHPLTWLSHMLDVSLFGPGPRGPHAVNGVLHLMNTLLLWAVLRGATAAPWASTFVALLFAIHPLHVESVAWISERKDVLSTLFLLLALGSWLRYARRPCISWYAMTVVCFALGLLAKPMLVTLPLLLLFADAWPLGRLAPSGGGAPVRRAIAEKLPLLLLSLGSAAVTVLAQQQGGSLVAWESFPIAARLGNAARSYVSYLGAAAWPHGLSAFYPFRPHSAWTWEVFGATALLVAATVGTFLARRGQPHLLFGWLWYLVTLVPVIGLVQVGMQSSADRYTYVPLIGPFVAATWGLARIGARGAGPKAAIAAFGTLAVVALAAAAARQVPVWRDNLTLFSHARNAAPANWVAEYYLGLEMNRLGRSQEAIRHYRELLRLAPDSTSGHDGLGVLLAQSGQLAAAAGQFQEAIRLDARYAPAHGNLGLVFAKTGRLPEAISHYEQALALDPDLAWVHNNFAAALRSVGRTEEAIAHYARSLELDPANRQAHLNLGTLLHDLGRREEAARHFEAAAGRGNPAPGEP